MITANTDRAGEVIQRQDLGHLGVGGEGDLAVLRVRKGKFGFADPVGGKRIGAQRLACELTVRAGKVV